MFGWLHRKCNIQKAEHWIDGLAAGHKGGHEIGFLEGRIEGEKTGYQQGLSDGYQKAKVEVRVEGHRFYRTALQGLMYQAEEAYDLGYDSGQHERHDTMNERILAHFEDANG